ncbi:PASTA domain-containing protein [Streptomyces sp. NPDC046909]|uniref:PASTA domain-containing protein n=1 Tax=Streptomyces sp. NPDC046909 TaxID=3155617 RepID=UPI0033CA207E
MTIHVFLQTTGKSAIRKVAVLLVFVLALTGCDREALRAVKAVAVGVPSLAPFFDEKSGLGQDAQVASRPVRGSLQQGDTPGLYGGSKQPTVCDVDKLEQFLTDPRNDQKAQAWARALNITTDRIPKYLDRLTPVLLRHDTLVKNHDYKKGKAVPYDSLLQAGIAILVDRQGQPAVKCSCGNPLRPFAGDTSRISVKFEDGNKEWKGYDRSSVVAVRPAARPLEQIDLVDVDDPDRGIKRPVGTAGTKDTEFDTREKHKVPNLAGASFGQARQTLIAQGLAVGYDSAKVPPDDAQVVATDPPAGTDLGFGQYVMLSVAEGSDDSGGPTSTPPQPSTSGPSSPGPSTSGPSSSGPSSSGPSSSGPSSSGPSSSGPSSSGPSSSGPSTPANSSSAPTTSSAPPSTSAPPTTTSAPPPTITSAPPPTTTSAPPPTTSSAPPPPVTTSAPPSSETATEEPTASAAA